MPTSKQVFISYSQQDQPWVRRFVDNLVEQGVAVWVDEKEIAVGESIAEKLEEGLRNSDSLLFVINSGNIDSPNLQFDLGVALGMGKRWIAVVDRDLAEKDLPWPIRSRRYVLRGEPEETAREIAQALAAA